MREREREDEEEEKKGGGSAIDFRSTKKRATICSVSTSLVLALALALSLSPRHRRIKQALSYPQGLQAQPREGTHVEKNEKEKKTKKGEVFLFSLSLCSEKQKK